MKRAVFTMAGVLLLAGAFYLGTLFSRPSPTPRTPERDATHDLGLQKTCSEASARDFRNGGLHPKPHQLSGYRSHYNTRLGKCFILVEMSDSSHPESSSTFERLRDVFDGTGYGVYYSSQEDNDPKRKPPSICGQYPDGIHLKKCRSDDEWDAYKNKMMTE